jgi:hypothetical protein
MKMKVPMKLITLMTIKTHKLYCSNVSIFSIFLCNVTIIAFEKDFTQILLPNFTNLNMTKNNDDDLFTSTHCSLEEVVKGAYLKIYRAEKELVYIYVNVYVYKWYVEVFMIDNLSEQQWKRWKYLWVNAQT